MAPYFLVDSRTNQLDRCSMDTSPTPKIPKRLRWNSEVPVAWEGLDAPRLKNATVPYIWGASDQKSIVKDQQNTNSMELEDYYNVDEIHNIQNPGWIIIVVSNMNIFRALFESIQFLHYPNGVTSVAIIYLEESQGRKLGFMNLNCSTATYSYIPWNWWLEDESYLFKMVPFKGDMLIFGEVTVHSTKTQKH